MSEHIVTRYIMLPEEDIDRLKQEWIEREDLVKMEMYITRKCKEDGKRIVYCIPVEPLEKYAPVYTNEKTREIAQKLEAGRRRKKRGY